MSFFSSDNTTQFNDANIFLEKYRTRPALGEAVELGALYDARDDRFCRRSAFDSRIPDNLIGRIDCHHSDVRLVSADNFTQKAEELGLDCNLRLSVLTGLIKVGGASRYLNGHATPKRNSRTALFYDIKTCNESLNLDDRALLPLISRYATRGVNATHIVSEISWGAQAFLTCNYVNTTDKDVNEIKESLNAQLISFKYALAAKISGQSPTEWDDDDSTGFSFQVYGDVISKEFPASFAEALEVMRQVPSLMERCNQGKGKPLVYTLVPLTMLTGHVDLSQHQLLLISDIREAAAIPVVRLFEKLAKTQQEINDLYQDVQDHSYCLKAEDAQRVEDFRDEFDICKAEIKNKLGRTLIAARMQNGISLDISSQVQTYQHLCSQLKDFHSIARKIAFAKSFTSREVKYIGSNTCLDDELINHVDQKLFVLFYNENASRADFERWLITKRVILVEAINSKCFIADCDLHPDCWPENGISIHVYDRGILAVTDYVNG